MLIGYSLHLLVIVLLAELLSIRHRRLVPRKESLLGQILRGWLAVKHRRMIVRCVSSLVGLWVMIDVTIWPMHRHSYSRWVVIIVMMMVRLVPCTKHRLSPLLCLIKELLLVLVTLCKFRVVKCHEFVGLLRLSRFGLILIPDIFNVHHLLYLLKRHGAFDVHPLIMNHVLLLQLKHKVDAADVVVCYETKSTRLFCPFVL